MIEFDISNFNTIARIDVHDTAIRRKSHFPAEIKA